MIAEEPCTLKFLRKEHFDEIYLQNFTDYSNSLMVESRKVYNRMVDAEKKFHENNNDSVILSDSDEEIIDLNRRNKEQDNEEMVYLDNLYNKVFQLQKKIEELHVELSFKNK